jgi:homoserine dehydrogenase
MFYGPGAGGDATASAVIADLVDIVRGNQGPMLGYKKGLESGLRLLGKEEIVTQYYLRLQAEDKSGVLATIASTLSGFGISVETMLQHPTKSDGTATLLFTTHRTQEAKMQEALKALEALDVVRGEVAMLRIEK